MLLKLTSVYLKYGLLDLRTFNAPHAYLRPNKAATLGFKGGLQTVLQKIPTIYLVNLCIHLRRIDLCRTNRASNNHEVSSPLE